MAATWTQETKQAYAAMKALGFKRGEFSAKQEYTKYGEYAGVRISVHGTAKDIAAKVGNPANALRVGITVTMDWMNGRCYGFRLSLAHGPAKFLVFDLDETEYDLRLATLLEVRNGEVVKVQDGTKYRKAA